MFVEIDVIPCSICSIVHEAYARQKGEFFVKKARAFFIFAGSEKKPFKCARGMAHTIQLLWHDVYCPKTLDSQSDWRILL